jgi:GT2 family glycosyltransferase
MTHVAVVVPTFRRPDLLGRCLEALSRQQYCTGQFDVIVADDAADETTRRQVEKLAAMNSIQIHYVSVTGRHGPAAARNAGWKIARGELIAFTDDDCIPDTNWLAAGKQPFADKKVVAVTGQTIVPLPPIPTDYERNTAGLEKGEFITANCFCRRAVLKQIGGFDEEFTIAWREDSDLHFRLLDTGGKIVRVWEAVVIHPARPAAWGVSLREQRKAAFDALLFRKHPRLFRERIHPACPWAYYLMLVALTLGFLSAALGASTYAVVAVIVWLSLTAQFLFRRLKDTSWRPAHIAEICATSILIPFLSIYWRLNGAARFRVFFW